MHNSNNACVGDVDERKINDNINYTKEINNKYFLKLNKISERMKNKFYLKIEFFINSFFN